MPRKHLSCRKNCRMECIQGNLPKGVPMDHAENYNVEVQRRRMSTPTVAAGKLQTAGDRVRWLQRTIASCRTLTRTPLTSLSKSRRRTMTANLCRHSLSSSKIVRNFHMVALVPHSPWGLHYFCGCPKMMYPPNGWFTWNIPLAWMIWGYPYFGILHGCSKINIGFLGSWKRLPQSPFLFYFGLFLWVPGVWVG